MKPYDATIIGGGVAGSALATKLAQAGRSVVLFEKTRGPHDKVCGEFISHEGAHYLAELGISLDSLGSLPIEGVRLARSGSPISADLPFQAQSLSRQVLDEALLEHASKAGAEVRRGARVLRLTKGGEHWCVLLDSGEETSARQAFLATGKHDLQGWKRPPGVQPDLMAFKIYWRLLPEQHAELDRHVELALFPGGYAGLQPVEGGRANLCLLVQKSSFAAKYGSWENLLLAMKEACPHLRRRLEGAQCLFEKPLAISGLPYGYVAERSGEVWRLGDQAAVIPSFSGDGMSIALHSATRAAEYYLRGEDADCYQRVLSYELRTQVARATAVSKALVRAFGQRAAMALLGIIPSLLPLSAALTRIPVGALRKFGP